MGPCGAGYTEAYRLVLRADSGSFALWIRIYPGQASEHDADHGETDEGNDGAGVSLEVAGEPSVARDPGEGALDDPSLGQNDEGVHLGALDDFEVPGAGIGNDRCDPRSLIGSIGEQLDDGREATARIAQQATDAIAILDIAAMDDNVDEQA